ncbi:MAG: hypothetical protein GY947_22635 [Rhodobacteraceae bacterium]|nr:hypothetical protein [Paracoccaceae bacterium]
MNLHQNAHKQNRAEKIGPHRTAEGLPPNFYWSSADGRWCVNLNVH